MNTLKDTDYCTVLAEAWIGPEHDRIGLQRIRTKAKGAEEIRLVCYQNGKYMMRAADIEESLWNELFDRAIKASVFTSACQLGMVRSLQGRWESGDWK